MRSTSREIMFNIDNYQIFQNILSELYQEGNPGIKTLITELNEQLSGEGNPMEHLLSLVQVEEKKQKMDPLLMGVIYFFVGKIYSWRKEFALSLSIFEKSEKYLSQFDSQLASRLRKEIHLLKMAYHFSDN